MCEYCGCQAVTAIDELTREHDLVVNMIGDVRAAYATGDTATMAELGRRIAAVLGPHTEVEEQGLFPLLTDEFPDHVAALRDEHRRIEAVLDAAATGTPADPAWPAELLATLEMLREHILKEQDGAFPAALTSLSGADWDTVDAVRARVGTLLPRATVALVRAPSHTRPEPPATTVAGSGAAPSSGDSRQVANAAYLPVHG